MLQDVLQQIEQHDRFVLTSHARPDGDAIGSALACCQILRAMGKQADVVLHDGVPRIYRGLPFADQVLQADRMPNVITRRRLFWNVIASTAHDWKGWRIAF